MARQWLIVDLEATCWENDPEQRQKSEVIEIGGVLFDPQEGRAEAEFQTFVRPVNHPQLSDFCRKLTTIRQDQVESAPLFPDAIERLCAALVGERAVTLASWGDYDRQMLQQECKRHGVRWPFGKKHINIKQAFAEWKRCRPCGLGQALAMAGMTFEGTAHRGIDDARQIARIAARLPEA